MSETRSASKKQGGSKDSESQITRTSHGRTAKIRRTREVIETVEVEHEAENGQPPVITTAEQRVFKSTAMERGKHISDEPTQQEQITSSARKQPTRGAKKATQTETDIPIQGSDATHGDTGTDWAGHDGPHHMSTQDYLEEAEELLTHPLDPTQPETQPEGGAPAAAATEQAEADAGNLTEQTPEEAAAAGEHLAVHIQPAPGTEAPRAEDNHGEAHANEGGLVGRVAQVSRRIVRSLLHPDQQGSEEAHAAAARGEAAHNQGEASEGEAAAQEYHVEEPDHSASEVEESPAQSKGRRRPKKADKTLTQAPGDAEAVEEVLAAVEEEAAPAPKTPPAKRGRPSAPKTPPTFKGKGKAAVEELAEAQKELTAPEAAEGSAPKKGRGRPAKAAKVSELSTPKQAAKRSRAEPVEQAAEEDKSKKSQKTDEAGAGRATPRKTPRAAPKSAASKSVPKTPSKASARTKGPQKKAARKPANRRKERPESFKIYLHRVLKEIHPDISVSQNAISVLDSFTKDMHDRIAQEAGDLCRRHNKATLSSREIDAAIRFLLPGELFNHAVAEGRKAVSRALSSSK